MSDHQPQPTEDIITCRVTLWYYRRMSLMALLLLAVGLYFLYDGKWGYPKENAMAVKKKEFETVQRDYDEAKTKGDVALKTWMAKAKEEGWVRDLESVPRWDAYAAEHNWPSNPETHSEDAIAQQFQFGYTLLFGTLICGGLMLLNCRKVLTGHADHMTMPDGKRIAYGEVFKVDKRKWDDKALAYVHYRTSADGQTLRATLDDL